MPTAAIRGRSFSPPFAKSSGKSTWKSSSVPIQQRALRSCPSDGSSSAPSPGSIAVAAWPRIGSASTERPWRSCALPQSASCSESSVKKQHDPGQTLTLQLSFFEVSALSFRLVGSAPERPCDDVCGLNPLLSESDGDAADFLDRPTDQ